jgi:hypothetical protein
VLEHGILDLVIALCIDQLLQRALVMGIVIIQLPVI